MKTRAELKRIRTALGLTQADVAKGAGISLVTMIKWETGHNVRPASERAIRDEIEGKLAMYDAMMTP